MDALAALAACAEGYGAAALQPFLPRIWDALRGVLLDGFARGTWKMERTSGRTDLVVEPFGPMARHDRAALAEEGGRLLAFAEPGAGIGEVRFVESG